MLVDLHMSTCGSRDVPCAAQMEGCGKLRAIFTPSRGCDDRAVQSFFHPLFHSHQLARSNLQLKDRCRFAGQRMLRGLNEAPPRVDILWINRFLIARGLGIDVTASSPLFFHNKTTNCDTCAAESPFSCMSSMKKRTRNHTQHTLTHSGKHTV